MRKALRFLGKPYRAALFYALALAAVFAYGLLDTFLIPRTINAQAEDARQDSRLAQQIAPMYDPVITDSAYDDGTISISISTLRVQDTTCYVADVTLADAALLRTALAQDTFGRNITQTTSDIAKERSALLAINGDFYGARNASWVLRNGTLLRAGSANDTALLTIDVAGDLDIVTAQALAASGTDGLMQVLSFGPALVQDGECVVQAGDEVAKARTSNPRTAIGQIDALHYVLLVSDGRTRQSEGLSLYDLATLMQSIGCTTAYNLDGGGSSTMVFMGQVINNPTSSGRSISQREVSDIVYIGY